MDGASGYKPPVPRPPLDGATLYTFVGTTTEIIQLCNSSEK